MELDARLREVARKLAELCARAPETFGSDHHAYRSNTPVAEAELAALERARGVTLPADFRGFITQIGVGGAGPYLGILPPAWWDRHLCGDAVSDWLARPCLFAPDQPRDDATYAALTAGIAEPLQGSIAIADQGCTYYAALVVSGPQRGRVMYVNVDGGVPYFVEHQDFLSWFERWVDELRWGHEHFWFGTGMAGDEVTLAAAARDATGPRRLDALHAMHRLPRVSDETAAIILDRVRDDDAGVRAAALAMVGKQRLHAAAAPVRAALADAVAAVRLEALLALVNLDTPWHDDARSLLRDPDDEIAARALRVLLDARALAAPELVALLDAPAAIAAIAIGGLATTPDARAVDVLFARAQAGTQPDALHALLQHVRAGLTASVQAEIAYALATARLAADPRRPCMEALTAFAATAHWPHALATIGALTEHADPFVRFDATVVLGDHGGAESIAALRALEADPTMPRDGSRGTVWSVGTSASKALARIRARLDPRAPTT